MKARRRSQRNTPRDQRIGDGLVLSGGAAALPMSSAARASTPEGFASSVSELPPSPTTEPAATETQTRANGARDALLLAAGRLGDGLRATGQRIRNLSIEQWLWIAVILLGAVLRFWGLGDKPLHHDESMHAYFSLIFAENPSSYSYDPLLHGPFQFHAEGLMFAIILVLQHIFVPNPVGNPWINDTTARFVPALFGIGIVALPFWLRRELGRVGALVAAFLLAVSPSFVYFSRFLREDIYFNFFMFLMVVCAIRYARERRMRWFVGLFAATILAYATFEGIFLTFVIFFSFLAVLLVWELAHSLARAFAPAFTERESLLVSRLALFLLFGAIAAGAAYIALHKMNELATYIATNTTKTDVQVQQLENTSVALLLYGSIVIALLVIGTLLWQMYRDDPRSRYGAEASGRYAEEYDEEYSGHEFHTHEDDAEGEHQHAHFAHEHHEHQHAHFAHEYHGHEHHEHHDEAYLDEDEWPLAQRRTLFARLRDRLDPDKQPFLRLLLGISWVKWFVAFVVAWMVFAVLYWIVPGDANSTVSSWGQGFQVGIGRGLWQGLYYWLEQQHVARGGQPWYYYLLLIPLYEQLAVVFGIAGIVYSLFRPTRFRIFLIWWFLGSLAIYSWAGEKMPWLSIHILLPLMLLAAVALDPVVRGCMRVIARVAHDGVPVSTLLLRPIGRAASSIAALVVLLPALGGVAALSRRNEGLRPRATDLRDRADSRYAMLRATSLKPHVPLLGALAALVLLVPMLYGMLTLTQKDAANAPHEMMVYVQTWTDVTKIMNRIQYADQMMYHGQHKIRIGVGPGMEWPFYWYLRDYPNAVFGYQAHDPNAQPMDVLILQPAGDTYGNDAQGFATAHPTGYSMKEYVLRWWWSEDYKPVYTPNSSTAQWGFGVGVGSYLSYGSNPPPNAKFNLGRATGRLWAWLWTRQELGDPHGSTDFVFVVRDGLPISAK
ncbi:MAG: hypothetical protein OJF49_001567 [Ktedonobacterales bacterium]|jgi:uncharacterized protein (TIGR03663 family)|nr:MAG: hypothetical protein OJF49_001567 [Ktedonobacterales bacterium]